MIFLVYFLARRLRTYRKGQFVDVEQRVDEAAFPYKQRIVSYVRMGALKHSRHEAV